MSVHLNRGRDLAGWLGASAVAAVLFGGAAVAALRASPVPLGAGQARVVALDLSVGVVPLSALLPSEPPRVVELAPPMLPETPQDEFAPDLTPALTAPEQEPAALLRPDLPAPAIEIPQAETPPVLAAAPPPPPFDPPLQDLAESPRPMARPDRAKPEGPARPETRQAEAPRATEATPPSEREPKPAPRVQAQAAQPAGADQAARPAQERRVAGGRDTARYGDQVMRQIARLRRKTAPERGVVTVGFEIAADGGLRRVTVVSSSGSAALDQVAMDHIHRAAPFAPPPDGAPVRFAFEFVGK